MNIRRFSLTAALLLTASLGACSDTDDPADNNDDAIDGSTLPDVSEPDADADESETEDSDGQDDAGDAEDTSDSEDAEDAEDSDEPDSTVGECPAECTDGCGEFSDASCGEDSLAFDYIGQLFDGTCGAAIPNGGCATTTAPATFDANIDELISQNTSTASDDPVTVDIDVDGAVVSATTFVSGGNPNGARRNFWIQDSNGSYQVRLGDDADLPPFDIRVGQKISFTATTLVKFFDTPQVDGVDVDSWTLESEGNDVFIEAGRAFSGDDVNTLAHVTGTVTSLDTSQSETGSCGGSSYCYVVSYGTDSSIIFRTASDFQPQIGDTVEFTGPLSEFGGDAQANSGNFEWSRVTSSDD